MFCTTCESACDTCKSLKSNAFVKGSMNFQRSALTRHIESDDHLLAKKILKEQKYMAAAKKCAHKSVKPILEAQMRTAAVIAEENMANRKFLIYSCLMGLLCFWTKRVFILITRPQH